jgi:soluble lytic murein transglycosylase
MTIVSRWKGFASVSLAFWLSAALAAPAQAMPVDSDGGPSIRRPPPLQLSPADRAIYAQAFRLANAERFDEARALSQTAQDPRLQKMVLWLDLSTPRDDKGSFPIIATFLAKNADWPGRGALQLHAEMVMPANMPDEQLLAWFDRYPALTVSGAMRQAAALERRGSVEDALAVARATWVGQRFSGTEESAFLARYGRKLSREDHEARLDRLLWKRDFRGAARQARRLGAGHVALAEARHQLALNRPGVDAAIRRVPQELQNDHGMTFERARWRQKRGRYADVVELLDPPAPDAPEAERWWSLRHWTIRQALLQGDISVAYRVASNHGMSEGVGFSEAEWLAGWIALRFLNEPGFAYRHFARLHEGVSTPVSLGRGAFWAGEAAHALAQSRGDMAWWVRAQQWYEAASAHDTSYYGQLAARRLGRDPVINLAARSAPSDEIRNSFYDSELVTIVRLLQEAGASELMERFLFRLIFLAETGKDYALVAELADSVGRPDLAMRTARSARGDGIILPGYLFPSMDLPNQPEPEQALLLALIRQESGFYQEAVSRAGARGLMQIMPATAKQVAQQIRVAYNGDKLLSDPEYNILLGRTYLSDLLDRFGGSYVLALAGYNAGPARVNGWIGAFGNPRDPAVDVIDWIESIPIDETRNYVQRILEGLSAYRQQLGTALDTAGGLPDLAPFAMPVIPAAVDGNLSCCL